MSNQLINLELKFLNRQINLALSVDPECPTDQELITAIRIASCPEPETVHVMGRVCRPGDYVIDGGANIGFFSVLASKLVGPEGQVLAFEPGANNIVSLKDNIKVNDCYNIEIVQAPLWSCHQPVQLYLCADGGKNSLAGHVGTRGTQDMETVVLEDYATGNMLDKIRLIKLDIEGAEEEALRGATRLLRRQPFIVTELNVEALPKFGSSAVSVCDFLRDFGYSPFLIHFNGSLPSLIPRGTKVYPNRLNWNVLFSTIEQVGEAWKEIVA